MSKSNQGNLLTQNNIFKIFISWSGEISHKVAKAFRTWIIDLVPNATAFVSSEDISKGAGWFEALTALLDKSDFGIVCITEEGMRTEWLNFELGWLRSKGIPVSPFLFDVEKAEIKDTPEENFQLTFFQKDDVNHLIKDIIDASNKKSSSKMVLDRSKFEEKWASLEKEFLEIQEEHPKVSYAPGVEKNIFKSSDSVEFKQNIERLVKDAKKIIMIGTGLNILFNEEFKVDLLSKASKGECELEIYLADPESPSIAVRLIEEELGVIRPPVGYENLLRRLDSFLDKINQLDPTHIKLKLFSNYPTFALIVVDNEYFFYPYGYATLGNFSPVVYFSQTNPTHEHFIKFLNSHYQLIKERSIDAFTILSWRESLENIDIERLHPLALFFIPSKNSPLYKFGSQVLGYDIHQKKTLNSTFKKYVGNADIYGFHLTICDVLYFLNESEVRTIEEEIKFLVKKFKFREFNLTGLQLTGDFPDQESISITVEDPTGNLEVLHSEIVHRVYQRAIASNYSLGLAPISRSQDSSNERSNMMIKRYKAPYILQHYRPHFTLLTKIPSQAKNRVYRELMDSFESINKSVNVDKIAIMSYNKDSKTWFIKELISLG